jgi:hypothetical protein
MQRRPALECGHSLPLSSFSPFPRNGRFQPGENGESGNEWPHSKGRRADAESQTVSILPSQGSSSMVARSRLA